jgi:hypothetical protein
LTRPWTKRRVISYEIAKGKDFFGCPDQIGCDLVPRPSCIERLPGVRSHQGQDCLPTGRDLRDEQEIHRHLDPG